MIQKANSSNSSNSSPIDSSNISPHVHDEESVRQIVNRLSRIEGHVRGIKTMVKRTPSLSRSIKSDCSGQRSNV